MKWPRNFFLSLLIHVILIAALAAVAVRIYDSRNSVKNSETGESRPEVGKTQIAPQQVSQALEKEQARIAKLSAEERMAELQAKSADIKDMDSQSVNAAAVAVETIKGADKSRAYEPRKNVAGKFDPGTATIYDIQKETGDDQPVFTYTLVDARGRSMKVQRELSEMSADDMRAYQVFTMSRNNENLARLVKSAVMIAQPQAE